MYAYDFVILLLRRVILSLHKYFSKGSLYGCWIWEYITKHILCKSEKGTRYLTTMVAQCQAILKVAFNVKLVIWQRQNFIASPRASRNNENLVSSPCNDMLLVYLLSAPSINHIHFPKYIVFPEVANIIRMGELATTFSLLECYLNLTSTVKSLI